MLGKQDVKNKTSTTFRIDSAKLPPELGQNHSLKCLNDNVMKRYSDRPEKLQFHLPFNEVPKPDLSKPYD